MAEIRSFDERRRPRQNNFSALSAGMIERGRVPTHVLYGGAESASPRPAAPIAEPAVLALPAEAPRTTSGGAQRKALTVRLDPVHHMRLRLVGSYLRRSAQDIMVQALNAYLEGLPQSVTGRAAASGDHD